MFILDNNYIFLLEYRSTMSQIAEIKTLIGSEYTTSAQETDTQIIIQWQKFDLSAGVYMDDPTYTANIEYMGNMYVPINGRIVIDKEVGL